MENINSAKSAFNRVGIKMIIATGVLTAVQRLFIILARLLFAEKMSNVNFSMAVAMLPLFVVGYPLAFIIMKNSKQDGLECADKELKKMNAGQIVVAFIMCYGIAIVGNLLGILVTKVISIIKMDNVSNPLVETVSSTSIISTLIFLAILAPICEEFLFRKLIIDKLVRYGEKTAIVLAALMFALFHLNFNQFFYAFFLGIMLGIIYVKTNNVKNGIYIHMMVNMLGSVIGGAALQYLDRSNPVHLAILSIYSLCIYVLGIAGIIILIVNRKKMTLQPGIEPIEKKAVFKTAYLNVGILCYFIIYAAITVAQAFFL